MESSWLLSFYPLSMSWREGLSLSSFTFSQILQSDLSLDYGTLGWWFFWAGLCRVYEAKRKVRGREREGGGAGNWLSLWDKAAMTTLHSCLLVTWKDTVIHGEEDAYRFGQLSSGHFVVQGWRPNEKLGALSIDLIRMVKIWKYRMIEIVDLKLCVRGISSFTF